MGNIKYSEVGSVSRKVVVGVAIILVIVAGILFVISKSKNPAKQQAASNNSGYQATADAFIKAVSRNNAQAAWDLMSSSNQKKTGSVDNFKKQLSNSYFNQGTGSPTFVKAETQPDQYNVYKDQDPHRVTYEFKFNSTKWQSVVIVVKDKSSWKVDEMDSSPL